MSHRIEARSILGVWVMLAGCAYPHLQMGEGSGAQGGKSPEGGASPREGGSSSRGGSHAAGGTRLASGGSSAAMPIGGASAVRSTGGATASGERFATGGELATPASGGHGGASGGAAASGGSSVGSGGIGGAVSATGGAVSATGGAGSGTGGAVSGCSANLVALTASSGCSCWFGGEVESPEDNICGFQGSIYAYGDTGFDGISCNSDDTLDAPTCSTASGGEYASPCVNGRCCIRGTTSVYRDEDYSAQLWGAGIGILLGTDTTGSSAAAYSGPAKGLTIGTSGSLSGQNVYFRYLQRPGDNEPPYRVMTSDAIGTISLPFTSVTCGPSATEACKVGQHPYILQIDVEGGSVAGPFELCIDSLTPIL